MSKISGKVEWFSNRKGFGFIAPTSDNAPTKDSIFVHQTSIFSDGDYRTLVEGTEVEFDVETEESGKLKAVNVTAPGGTSIKPPARERKRKPRKPINTPNDSAPSGEPKKNGGKKKDPASAPSPAAVQGPPKASNKPPRDPPFHVIINEESKTLIEAKGVELGKKVTVDVALGDSRIKLGQGGYAGLAQANGTVGEGTYECNESGYVNFNWERSLEFKDGKWSLGDASKLLKTLSLVNDDIKPVENGETAESLWGEDKGDPKDALEEHGFKMKRIVLTRPPGSRPRGRRPLGNRSGGGRKNYTPK